MRTMASAQVTELLHAWGAGDETALHQLVPLVESELRRRCVRLVDKRVGTLRQL